MSYFTAEWFYHKFTHPDCYFSVSDKEYMVSLDVPATSEDRDLGGIPTERLDFCLLVEMPQMTPCVFLSNVDEEQDPFSEEDSSAALAALKRLVRERHDCGLASYWHTGVLRDDPGYRPLTEKEQQRIESFLEYRKDSGPLCKNAQDAIYTIEHMCALIIQEMDELDNGDPLLADHLACFTALRREILRGGLPTIQDRNMFYEIVYDREAVFVLLCHVQIQYSLHKLLNIYDKNSEDTGCALIPYRTVLYSVPFPVLTCAQFASRCGVDQVTVRQWIRRGKLRTAFKVGRDWMIPATTKPPGRGFMPGLYDLKARIPREAVERYPFLDKVLSHEQLLVDKAGPGKYNVIKVDISEKVILATLSQAEREKFEFFLLEQDWVKCNMETRILPTKICPQKE